MEGKILIVCLLAAVVVAGGCVEETDNRNYMTEVKNELEAFGEDIELAVSGSSAVYTSYNLSNKTGKDELTNIREYLGTSICIEYCGTEQSVCNILVYTDREVEARKCLDIPYNTAFPGMPGQYCPPIEGLTLQDLSNEVKEGHYLLVQKRTATAFKPLCAYWSETEIPKNLKTD